MGGRRGGIRPDERIQFNSTNHRYLPEQSRRWKRISQTQQIPEIPEQSSAMATPTRLRSGMPAQGGDKLRVTLTLLNGSGLRARDRNGLSDPYVALAIGGMLKTSKVCDAPPLGMPPEERWRS